MKFPYTHQLYITVSRLLYVLNVYWSLLLSTSVFFNWNIYTVYLISYMKLLFKIGNNGWTKFMVKELPEWLVYNTPLRQY